ncbi:MAG TPA: DUF1361 domain-containing protein [Candidatus Saccharimonadales bacterium]|nr:DUF1361 domain-containing protein [Candidatus Saccharimonadales bacterium]
MGVILFNFSWMTFNVILASIAVVLGWLFFLTSSKILKLSYIILWLLFEPNTVYLFTDLLNLINQWVRYNNFEKVAFLFQYGALEVICIITSVLSLYPIEKFILSTNLSNRRINPTLAIVVINIVVGFGVTLGRVERINSWDVFFNTNKVIESCLRIIATPSLLALTILFGFFANLLYFLFRKPIIEFFNIYLSQADAKA